MKIVIVGLGVIGGSFGLALREAGFHEVYGIDADQSAVDKAKELGIIRQGSTSGQELLGAADLTILAIYPQSIKAFLVANRENFKTGSIITDTTGVKGPLVAELAQLLPMKADVVLGHPMAGREKRGLEYASASVFKGANYLLTPLPSNQEVNLQSITDLVYQLGFKNVRRLTPQAHDEMISFTSQLPHAIAVALMNSDEAGRRTGEYIGDSFRDLTRIANINGPLWSELFLENREALLASIEKFEFELLKIKEALSQANSDALMDCFAESSRRRELLD
jgi:prephenate dehydrogenase